MSLLYTDFIYVIFIILAGIVVISASKTSCYVVYLKEKSKLATTFFSVILLSLITALPELVTSITSVGIDEPLLSFNNIIGANVFTIVSLIVLDVIFVSKYMFNNISKTNIKMIIILLVFNILAFVNINLPTLVFLETKHIMLTSYAIIICGFNLSWLFLFFIIFYGFFIYRMFESKNEIEEDVSANLTKKAIIIRLIITSLVLVVTTVALTKVVNLMAAPSNEGGRGLGQTFAGALLLAICTGLPEISSAFYLIKKNQTNIAVGGLLGSNLLNIFILAISDVMYYCESTLELVSMSESYLSFYYLFKIAIFIYLLILLKIISKDYINKKIYLLPNIIIIVLYFYMWFSNKLIT